MYRFILISTFTLYLLILSAQAGLHSVTSIVLSAKEISAIEKDYNAKVAELAKKANTPTAASATGEGDKSPTQKKQETSAQPLFNATVDAIKKSMGASESKPRIFLFGGQTANGGYAIEAANIFLDNKYQVTFVVIPRYKTEVLKEEGSNQVWEAQLIALQKAHVNTLIVVDFTKEQASKKVTDAINEYRKELMKDHKVIYENRDSTEERVTIHAFMESVTEKQLKKELDVLLAEEGEAIAEFLEAKLELSQCVVIDAIVAAGYEDDHENLKKHVFRRPMAQAITKYFNTKKSKDVITGSYDLLSNTTMESGYYHVSKDGKMTVTLIPHSHIPDFMVLITVPRESVMALESTLTGHGSGSLAVTPDVAYQYRKTSMYLTVYVDKAYPGVSMAQCIDAETSKRTRNNNDIKQDPKDADTLKKFIEELRNAENNYKKDNDVGGFLHLDFPETVENSVAYIAGIGELDEKSEVLNSVCIRKVTTNTKYLDFGAYVNMLAKRSE